MLSPKTTEGPYWIDDALSRRDIREGKAGLPLVAAFTVQDALVRADHRRGRRDCDSDGYRGTITLAVAA